MNDEQRPGSGSRWEPTPPPTGANVPPPPPPPVTPEPYDAPTPPPVRSRSTWMRTRGAIAGGAAAALAVFTLGGFAVGHATAGDGDGSGDHTGQFDRGFGPDGDHAPPGQPPGDLDGDGEGLAPQQPDQGDTDQGSTGQGAVEGSDTAYLS
ncbi:hypothetical protein ACT8ZV_03725 [Nocardioides sp. MAHUQ-72]|uniref:hypothetical protein n=1 Tax=unclassified Nocardioides TaxID=2615069 RepID=UPI00361A1E6F